MCLMWFKKIKSDGFLQGITKVNTKVDFYYGNIEDQRLIFQTTFMAQLNATENIIHKKGRPRIKKANLRIDMTPMVDLGFLLICFFVYTTTMSEPKATDLFVPKDGPPILIGDSASLTVLLGKENQVSWYDGNWDEAVARNAIQLTDYSVKNGLGNIIREKQKRMNELSGSKEGRNGLMLIIKATKDASYKNLIDVVDEVLINDVRHYAVVEPTTEETKFMQ